MMRILFVLLFALTVSACGGLPSEKVSEAKGLSDALAGGIADLEKERASYKKELLGDSDMSLYAKRDKWEVSFDSAKREYVHARQIIDTDVKAILDRNKVEEVTKLDVQVARARASLKKARDLAKEPRAMIALVRNARANASAWIAEAPLNHKETQRLFTVLTQHVVKAESNHPNRAADIKARFKPAATFHEESQLGLEKVLKEAERKASGMLVDYALLANGYVATKRVKEVLRTAVPKLVKDLASLDSSYSKILVDMKDAYEVCASRTSWEEGEYPEFPTETNYDYSCRSVDEDAAAVAEAFDDADAEFATHARSWGSWSTRLHTGTWSSTLASEDAVQDLWNQLKLEPREGYWPSTDNEASYWVRDLKADYQHRYAYIENGVRREGEWEPVSEAVFDAHFEHLGMAVAEKAIGQFDDEAMKIATPPGMSFVGNPKAGSWQQNASGGSSWVWIYPYNIYGGLYGPGWGGYTDRDHRDWQKERDRGSVYWGGSSGSRQYGTYGNTTKSGYSTSSYASRGGFRESAGGLRGAGPDNRSGGPQSGK